MTETSGKASPFSIRLSQATNRMVESEAGRTKRSKSAVVEALTEEAARMRRFPGVAFRGDDAGRRPWVIGTGLDVWQIIEMHEDLGAQEALEQAAGVTAAQLRLAVAYRDQYPDEIAGAIAENRRHLDDLVDLYPFIEVESGS